MPTFVVGDVHGHRDTLAALLRDCGLVDTADRWSGADARLWLVGDLVDRGPDGIGAIELVMALEQQGDVRCLLGNHELFLLAVDRHPDAVFPGGRATFAEVWLGNGGRTGDLRALDDEHRRWLERRPPLARDGAWLLLHADTTRYLELGASVEGICASASMTIAAADPDALAHLVAVLCDRGGLDDPAEVDRLLLALGGERIVHGHTPIPQLLGVDPVRITAPLVTGGGRVVNVDHCLFAGGPGFVFELD